MSALGFVEKLLDGAEVIWEPLSQVAKIKNGKDWKNLGEGEIPVYGSGGIMGYVDTFAYDKPTVLIPRKGTITNVFYVDIPFWNVDTIYYTEVKEEKINPKFFYYFMKTIDLMALDTGSGRPSLTQAILNKLLVPIPCPDNPEKSLAIQAEIVRILDKFTALTTELTTELNARKKQYNYYRDQLLSFEEEEVKWKKLGDVATIGTGSRNTNEAVENGKYPFFVRSQIPRKINEYEFDETALITAGDGVGVGKVFHYVNGKYGLHQRAYRIVVHDHQELNPKFLYYYFVSNFYQYITRTSVHASVTSLRKPMFEKYIIPIPPVTEQNRIVTILDKFDALSNSISEGLPREIELRQKQYEYYRNLLLSFPKPEVTEGV